MPKPASRNASPLPKHLWQPPAPHPPMSSTIVAQLTELPKLSMEELRRLWRKHFPNANALHHRAFLEKRLAHRLQEIEFRKHQEGRRVLDRNHNKIEALIAVGKTRRRGTKIVLTPGTLLTREYRDAEHQVLVGHDGSFEYRGLRYASLSKIATDIVGSAISGPVFFGLKPNASKAKASPRAKGQRL
jgi:hypothetical protein